MSPSTANSITDSSPTPHANRPRKLISRQCRTWSANPSNRPSSWRWWRR